MGEGCYLVSPNKGKQQYQYIAFIILDIDIYVFKLQNLTLVLQEINAALFRQF